MMFPEDFVNKIICGDCISVMKQMPDECLDLVVTSPPYNLKNSTGNGMKMAVVENGKMRLLLMATTSIMTICLTKNMFNGKGIVYWKCFV
jgi:DNA modification methylase